MFDILENNGILRNYGFCPFCLSIKNYTSFVRAMFNNGPPVDCPREVPTHPNHLHKWLTEMLEKEGFDYFILNAANHTFIPIAVIKQTPVCTIHLWDITDPNSRIKL